MAQRARGVRQREAQADLFRVFGQNGFTRNDDEARAVVIGILNIGGDDFKAVFLRRLRGADCADALETGFGDEFCGSRRVGIGFGFDVVCREIRTALHEGLMLREHLFDRTRPLCAAQAVAHGNIRRTDDEHAVLHDEVIDLRDTAGIGIFDRHHAVIARAVMDSFKNIAEAG